MELTDGAMWLIGTLLAVFAGLFGYWFKVESRQDHKIDQMAKTNMEAHSEIHKKIDANHKSLVERIDQLISNLVTWTRKNGDK